MSEFLGTFNLRCDGVFGVSVIPGIDFIPEILGLFRNPDLGINKNNTLTHSTRGFYDNFLVTSIN
jgi:hypothetical protein